MDTRQHSVVLRSQLLRMSRLSQRAVDYSIKAYELGRPEFCGYVRDTGQEFGQLHRCIEYRCRKLLAHGLAFDSESHFVRSALRICGALHKTYTAAVEVTENTMLFLEGGGVFVSPAPKEMGHLANRLVRLCTVALFKENAHYARTVLQHKIVGLWFEMAFYHLHSDIGHWIAGPTTLELVITKSFSQIIKQAREMADAITVWLGETGCSGVMRQHAVYVLPGPQPMRNGEEANQIVLSDSACFCPGES
jgi:hypothetical protein